MPPGIAILLGAWTILVGTLLYWPLERLRDWQASKPFFMMSPGFRIHHRIMLAIRNNPRWLLAYRAAFVVIGLILIAIGLR